MRKIPANVKLFTLVLFCLEALSLTIQAQQCGSQAGNATCANNLCCSQYGFCGSTSEYCGTGCQSHCGGGGGGGGSGVASIISSSLFDQMMKHRNDAACPGKGQNLLSNPDLVATNPTVSFKSALWFWMTPQSPKPSCHAVMTGQWTPSAADQSAGRLPGYGVVTNIINGGIECGKGSDTTGAVADRIGFYKRYCDLLDVSYGNNLDCYNMKSFDQISFKSTDQNSSFDN
ncbi:chitinase 1-like protein [Carex littledalei]|uniref:chitinase n=1 Tax=Carex littledalei TaxID=544730 RepID=A0A833QWY6_9POAL|nr:chitinase 1-like protein [Carex littledalei]